MKKFQMLSDEYLWRTLAILYVRNNYNRRVFLSIAENQVPYMTRILGKSGSSKNEALVTQLDISFGNCASVRLK